MPPLVTIGVTAFNAQDNIERAVRSALQQDWSNLEVVVVDDASSDQTGEIVERIVLKDSRVRLVRHAKNLGVGAARNSIINAASGEFVAFFDDDDESEASRIGAQWARIMRYEMKFAMGAPVICHTARLQTTGDGAERVEPTMGCREGASAPHGPAVASRILWGTRLDQGFGAVATCSQMARTSTYRATGGFDAAFRRSEDTEFCVRLALMGGHFVGIDSPLVRQKLTARADKTLDNELKYKLMLLAKHKQTAPTPGHFSAASGFLRFKYALQRRARFSALICLLQLLVTHPVLTTDRLDQAIRRGASKPNLAHFTR
ncbi:glycosyl transferase [Rhizobium sp. TH135]|uniref:glycosyltransferase family 2 protein n=1 Tax=Rhizobium sp. TH135 TaxID=2067451 RepID=UPI000C79E8AE|nr:glycosyltransferase [Rhizobium sp. TH135]PLK68881.1 glycosyl transferase [Rhizobium sp. TH135]